MFLFGGRSGACPGLLHVMPFAVMTFFAMLARELVKDAEDVEGDRASGAATLPIRYGIRATLFLAFSLLSWGLWQVLVRTCGGDSGTFTAFFLLMASSCLPA